MQKPMRTKIQPIIRKSSKRKSSVFKKKLKEQEEKFDQAVNSEDDYLVRLERHIKSKLE